MIILSILYIENKILSDIILETKLKFFCVIHFK